MVGPRSGRSSHMDETSTATCRQPGDEGPWSLAGEPARWCRRGAHRRARARSRLARGGPVRGGTGRVVRVTRWTGVLLLCATLVAITVLTGCGSEGPDGGGGSSAPTVTGSTSTGEVTTTTDDAPAVPPSAATTPRMTAPFTVPPPTTSSTALAPVPGQPCTPGSSPDCIDPEGDGSYVYLLGGAGCTASPIAGGSCGDLDGDGRAGCPDSG